ncbi:MAG: hypothetical protein A2Y12_01320 [Planctomycetes bacterium GWF2_42_9]|nr:MAG: hypothetical protein A2Y12_01320 [Planctomycetes bacterium GWF2_42_9]
MANEIDILTNAQAPAKVTTDAGSVEQHSIADQIMADKYAKSREAAKAKGLGFKTVKLAASGAV